MSNSNNSDVPPPIPYGTRPSSEHAHNPPPVPILTRPPSVASHRSNHSIPISPTTPNTRSRTSSISSQHNQINPEHVVMGQLVELSGPPPQSPQTPQTPHFAQLHLGRSRISTSVTSLPGYGTTTPQETTPPSQYGGEIVPQPTSPITVLPQIRPPSYTAPTQLTRPTTPVIDLIPTTYDPTSPSREKKQPIPSSDSEWDKKTPSDKLFWCVMSLFNFLMLVGVCDLTYLYWTHPNLKDQLSKFFFLLFFLIDIGTRFRNLYKLNGDYTNGQLSFSNGLWIFLCKKDFYLIYGKVPLNDDQWRSLRNWSDYMCFLYIGFFTYCLVTNFGHNNDPVTVNTLPYLISTHIKIVLCSLTGINAILTLRLVGRWVIQSFFDNSDDVDDKKRNEEMIAAYY